MVIYDHQEFGSLEEYAITLATRSGYQCAFDDLGAQDQPVC